MEKNDNFTALQSMQGILHITALQPCEFLPLLKTFFQCIVHCWIAVRLGVDTGIMISEVLCQCSTTKFEEYSPSAVSRY